MSLASDYLEQVTTLMRRVLDEEAPTIREAGVRVADTLADDRLLHVFGTGGHSAMGAEELFYRAGGLVPVNAVLDGGVLLAHGALRSTMIERTPGYARTVLDDYGVAAGDVLLIVNAYGINACTVESALVARERGCTTIAVTSVALQRALSKDHPSRHPAGHDLCDLADIVIDCKVPMGDALVDVPGASQKAGPSSTYLNALALNLIALEAIAELARRGVDPPIWQSANSPGGDAANADHIARYRGRVKRL